MRRLVLALCLLVAIFTLLYGISWHDIRPGPTNEFTRADSARLVQEFNVHSRVMFTASALALFAFVLVIKQRAGLAAGLLCLVAVFSVLFCLQFRLVTLTTVLLPLVAAGLAWKSRPTDTDVVSAVNA